MSTKEVVMEEEVASGSSSSPSPDNHPNRGASTGSSENERGGEEDAEVSSSEVHTDAAAVPGHVQSAEHRESADQNDESHLQQRQNSQDGQTDHDDSSIKKNGEAGETASDAYKAAQPAHAVELIFKDDSNPPRKRSKVSRACDSCRRKKVKCNAEYSPSVQSVTKICNNCIKNSEECTFSRVPLKRGPSKGYIRDLEEKLDREKPEFAMRYYPAPVQQNSIPSMIHQNSAPHQQHQQHPLPPHIPYQNQAHNGHAQNLHPTVHQSIHNGHAGLQGSQGVPSGPPVPPAQPLPFPQLKPAQIILPPLVGYHKYPNHLSVPDTSSTPSSPRSGIPQLLNNDEKDLGSSGNTTKNASPPIQGPFWKVPYEMPASSRRLSNASNGRRRSSLESISSTSTNGSRVLKRSSAASEGYSDSESEDFYSIKSGGSLPAASPRGSVSSLSSLAGRISKSLHIAPQVPLQPLQAFPSPFPQQPYGQQPAGQSIPSSAPFAQNSTQISYFPSAPETAVTPTSQLPVNLQTYYTHFHPCFPILPFSEKHLAHLIESYEHYEILELFNNCLHNLNNFRQLTLHDSIALVARVLSLYPLRQVNDSTLVIFFSSLVLLNYAILLQGEAYSLGISIGVAIFNDFKVLENFVQAVKENESVERDNVKMFLPKLYHSLNIIDDLYSLSFGVQKGVVSNGLVTFLVEHSSSYLDEQPQDLSSKSSTPQATNSADIFQESHTLSQLVSMRDSLLLNEHKQFVAPAPCVNSFSSLFNTVITEKFALYNFLLEINQFLTSSTTSDLDEVFETLMDLNLKLIRLMKKLTQTIMNFASHLSSPTNNVNPLLTISMGQLLRLIKSNKLIIDGLIKLIREQHDNQNHHMPDLLNRCVKINTDLSISFNLLNLNLANVQLGRSAVSLLRGKIEEYRFDFALQDDTSAGVTLKSSLDTWEDQFTKTVVPFIEKECFNGWF